MNRLKASEVELSSFGPSGEGLQQLRKCLSQ